MISEPLQRCGVRTRVFYDRVSMGHPRDGYVRDDLDRLRMYYDKGLIRNHVSQSAGWLQVIGMQNLHTRSMDFLEHSPSAPPLELAAADKVTLCNLEPLGGLFWWKVGYYEPTDSFVPPDTDFFYVVDAYNGFRFRYRYMNKPGVTEYPEDPIEWADKWLDEAGRTDNL